jgi:hypothetical protein
VSGDSPTISIFISLFHLFAHYIESFLIESTSPPLPLFNRNFIFSIIMRLIIFIITSSFFDSIDFIAFSSFEIMCCGLQRGLTVCSLGKAHAAKRTNSLFTWQGTRRHRPRAGVERAVCRTIGK